MNRKHHDLLAWQESRKLVVDVYKITAGFPREEMYCLTSQMRRAAVSIPSNIAEGAARTGKKEFLHFLSVARGSLSELETQLFIACDLGYLKDLSDIMAQVDKSFGLVGGLMNSIAIRRSMN